jgi:hypothetical protein
LTRFLEVNANSSIHSSSKIRATILLTVVVLTAPLWLALVLTVLLARLFQVVALYALVWAWWIGRARRRVLFVYSDSPNWKEHIESNILPKLPPNTVVLNWSHRRSWPKFNLSVILFRCFAGEREFNPIALVFERFDRVERYRFWQPFRDAKHGGPEALQMLEARLFKHTAV